MRTSVTEHRLFWRMYATVYDSMWDSPLTSALADEIARRTAGAGLVVDFGCGTGLATARVKGLVIGIDSSPEMIRQAKRRISNLRLAQVYDTGLETGCADVAVLANVLHLCAYPEKVLAEAFRVVKANGWIIVTSPTDKANIATVAQTQRALGWQRRKVALFIASALITGVMGALIGVTRHLDKDVSELIDASYRSDIYKPMSLFGIQNIMQIKVHKGGKLVIESIETSASLR